MTYKALSNSRAKILWDQEGRPYSEHFDDLYFSNDGGLEETHYVFIDGNKLPQRIAALNKKNSFTIGETGFGTGLNFLSTWKFWRERTDASLHFISVEKYPLSRNDLCKALGLWPQLKDQAESLIALYPPQPSAGFQRLVFDKGRTVLTLYFGDALEGFSQLCADTSDVNIERSNEAAFGPARPSVDAWYLDGFSPSKNPDMWNDNVCKVIQQLSHLTSTFATFTAASAVRRSLTYCGFECEKIKGFGRKREMLVGELTSFRTPIFEQPNDDHIEEAKGTNAQKSRKPRPRHFWHLMNLSEKKVESCLVIGGGMAGCHTARALAERDIQVQILERQSSLASGASGNKQGVVYAKLSPVQDPLSQFNLASLLFANRLYHSQHYYAHCGEDCGVLFLANDEKQQNFYRQLAQQFHGENFAHWLDAEECKSVSGVRSSAPGLFLPESGWLDPAAMCQRLVSHKKIQLSCDQDIRSLHYEGGTWHARDIHGHDIARADAVVITTAAEALCFEQSEHLPLKKIRGQVTHFQDETALEALKTVICGDGYVAPASQQRHKRSQHTIHTAGASFNLTDTSSVLSDDEHRQNLARLQALSPDFATISLNADALDGRVSFRCTTPDYLPLVGPLASRDKMLESFGILRKKAKTPLDAIGQYHPHLYCNVGHGSRGLSYSPLCANIVASLVSGEFLPLSEDLYRFVHPARFLIRDLIRNKI